LRLFIDKIFLGPGPSRPLKAQSQGTKSYSKHKTSKKLKKTHDFWLFSLFSGNIIWPLVNKIYLTKELNVFKAHGAPSRASGLENGKFQLIGSGHWPGQKSRAWAQNKIKKIKALA
jgi:hypothetical protein